MLFVHVNVEYISNCHLINRGFAMQNHKVVGRFCLFLFVVGGGVSLYGMNNGQCDHNKQVYCPLKVDDNGEHKQSQSCLLEVSKNNNNDNSTNGVNNKNLSLKNEKEKRKIASWNKATRKYRAKKKQKEKDLLDFVKFTTGISDDAKKAKAMALELKNELLALKLITSSDQSVFDGIIRFVNIYKKFLADRKSD